MKYTNKERFLKKYITLARWNEKTKIKCEVFCKIKDAVQNKDRDTLISIGAEHNLEAEESSWIIDEAIKILEDKDEHVRQFKEVQMKAKEASEVNLHNKAQEAILEDPIHE